MAQQFSIADFNEVVKGVNRPAYFNLEFTKVPSEVTALTVKEATVLARTLPMPSKTNNVIPIKFRGLEIKFPGDTTFDDWNCTFLVDRDNKAKRFIEDWYNTIFNIPNKETKIQIEAEASNYLGTIKITSQGDGTQGSEQVYVLENAFPSQLAEVELGSEGEAPLEFNCTFSYAFWNRED